jgi:DNA invertase Pin-like site-specific DNA recombinase
MTKVRSNAKRVGAPAPVEVHVRWEQVPATTAEVEQAARGIVETVTRYAQVRVDAPTLHAPLPTRDKPVKTAQAAAPLSCRIAAGRIVGAQFIDESGMQLRLLLDNGETIEIDEAANARARRKVAVMDDLTPKRRRPARTLSRPGQPKKKRGLDPLGGLGQLVNEFGEIVYEPAGDGATVGVLEMYPNGNTVLLNRVSGDENDTLAGQFGPNLGLCRQYPDILVPRFAIFAVHMSGTREIWPGLPEAIRNGAPQREDLLKLDRWIDEGWVENVVARDDDRIAREMIWHQLVRRRWKSAGVSLWLARFGRRMDYDKDRIALGAMALIAEEERVNINRRMQTARIDKGPLIGLGWGSKPRVGFLQDKDNGGIKQDRENWHHILRMFERADVDDANALSTREIAEKATAEGFEITAERVRTVLEDPIYATGEWSVKVRGVEIPQHPIELQEPVAIDRFQRVQDMLALRQGRDSATPIGEFLLNYVETVHTQCMDETRQRKGKREERPLIKGYIDKREAATTRRMFHVPYAPECCKGNGRGRCGAHSWQRDDIEPPIVEEIRRIAEHPELQRQFALAARHDVATSSSRLSEAQRQECEHEIARIDGARDEEMDRFVDAVAAGEPIDRADHDARVRRLSGRIDALRRRLEADDEAASRDDEETPRRGDAQRLRDFLEIMTLQTPEDTFHKQLRARLFQRVVQRVEIDDPGHGPVTIALYGHLVPETSPLERANPIHACHDLLDGYAERKTRKNADLAVGGASGTNPETAMEKVNDMAVWGELYSRAVDMPSGTELERRRRLAYESTSWRQRRSHQKKSKEGLAYSWSCALSVRVPERPVGRRARRRNEA